MKNENKLLFIRRGNAPYQGWPALTGGFVEVGETCEAAIEREAMEETGLLIDIKGLVGMYSNPARDSRGHVVSVCYFTIARGEPEANSDADDIVLHFCGGGHDSFASGISAFYFI